MSRPHLVERWVASRLERYIALDKVSRLYNEWQLEQFRPFLGQRILEIGCGVGSIIELLGTRELVYGVDLDGEILECAAERFRDRPECRFAALDFAGLPLERREELLSLRFDTVVCMNVLEHIPDDRSTILAVAEILAPGGILALLVPAHQALYGAYDAIDGHIRRYSKRDVSRLLLDCGLALERVRYFNALGAVGWWVQYKLLRRRIHGGAQFSVMNHLIPLLRRGERLLEPPFGLSVVAVGRRIFPPKLHFIADLERPR